MPVCRDTKALFLAFEWARAMLTRCCVCDMSLLCLASPSLSNDLFDSALVYLPREVENPFAHGGVRLSTLQAAAAW